MDYSRPGHHWWPFDPQHLSWPFILIPAILVASAIIIDNRFCGPYFSVADIVFSDFGTGTRWNDREILYKLIRRIGYVVAAGILLHLAHYPHPDIAGLFTVVGFLLIWPAFGRPLPVYVRKSDWHVLLIWGLYIVSIVAFGMFGAMLLSFIQAISGQPAGKFLRESLSGSVFWFGLGVIATAFRAPMQQSLYRRKRNPPSDKTKAR